MVDRIRQLYKVTHEMEQELGRVPTTEELAQRLEVPISKVEWMMRVSWLPLSLESPINDDEEDSELGQFVEDQLTPTPIESTYSKLLREKIEEVLDTCLPARRVFYACVLVLKTDTTIRLKKLGINLVSLANGSDRSKAKPSAACAIPAGHGNCATICRGFFPSTI